LTRSNVDESAPQFTDSYMYRVDIQYCVLVIDHLDVLKKDNAGAREAIRWLEAEFHKGNRLVKCSIELGSLMLWE